ncbi:MAG: hypothetical protein BZY88_01895 [SAR202 cluster bacterium Io17-Chloro-G9]|nr:MAG: hypothetical protein BZY88_01895 [SAR202 cluster bacterium Io17-Chloro-G9]
MSWFRPNPGGAVNIKRRVFSLPTLVSLAVAGAFLAFLVTRFDVDLAGAWDTVKAGNPWYLALAVAVHYTTFAFRGARWRLLLQNAQDKASTIPGAAYCSQLVLLGWFVNSVGWFRLGDAYRAYLYRDEQDASFSRTIGTVLAERVLDAVLVLLLLLVTVPFLVGGGQQAAWPVLGIAIVLVVALAGALLLMIFGRVRVLRTLPGRLADRYQRFHQGALASFAQLPPVTLWGLLGWLAEAGRVFLVVQALDLDVDLHLVIFITLANSLLTLVPTPGGLGAVESGVPVLLVRLSSLSATPATALVLVDRAITYLSIILVGACLFFARQALPGRINFLRPAQT